MPEISAVIWLTNIILIYRGGIIAVNFNQHVSSFLWSGAVRKRLVKSVLDNDASFYKSQGHATPLSEVLNCIIVKGDSATKEVAT